LRCNLLLSFTVSLLVGSFIILLFFLLSLPE
jgi:hypothetical protein